MLTRRPVIDTTLNVSSRGLSSIEAAMMEECEAMAIYAFGAGINLPPELLALMDSQLRPVSAKLDLLGRIHGTLSGLILPATPRAVALMHTQKMRHPLLTAFGPVPLVRWLLFVAMGSIIVMLGTALSPAVSHEAMRRDLLDGHGTSLLLCEIFLISASAIGTSFAILFRVNRYISDGTYDPRYSSTYFIQLVLGVISGVMLSQLLFNQIAARSSGGPQAYDQPLLALLGGFSSSLVYRILNRILVVVESLFGDQGRAARAPEAARLRCEPAPVSYTQDRIKTGTRAD